MLQQIVSQQVFFGVLPNYPCNSTKTGPAFPLKILQVQFQQSIKNLGEYLALYRIYSATPDSGVLEDQEVLDCLKGLRKSGIKIGLTVTGPNQRETIEEALSIRCEDEPLFQWTV